MVDEASNGQEAFELVKKSLQTEVPYHVILLDLNMPILDGFEACKRIIEFYKVVEDGLRHRLKNSSRNLQHALTSSKVNTPTAPWVAELNRIFRKTTRALESKSMTPEGQYQLCQQFAEYYESIKMRAIDNIPALLFANSAHISSDTLKLCDEIGFIDSIDGPVSEKAFVDVCLGQVNKQVLQIMKKQIAYGSLEKMNEIC